MPRESVRSMKVSSKDARILAAAHGAKKGRSATASSARAAPAATRGFAPGYGMRGNKGEKKVIDTVNASYACDNTGSVTALNLCAAGTDYTNRTGRLIKLESVQIRGHVFPQDDTTSNHLAKVALIWDSQPNGGAIATYANMFNENAQSSSFINLTNRDRFKVIREHFFSVGKVDNTATTAFSNHKGGPEWVINDWVRLGDEYVTQYGGTGATIGDIQHGALLLVTFGDIAANLGSYFDGSCRVRFTDA